MAGDDDWRLQGQETYLMGATLRWKRYAWQPNWNVRWDHDHCDFCWAKFMDDDLPEVLREGHTNTEQAVNGKLCPQGEIWICAQCFADFHQRFGWQVDNERSKEV